MEEFRRDCCTRGYPVYTELLEKCWSSAGVCERAAQHLRSICCGCEKDGNNHWTFTAKVVKSVFVVFVTRGNDILYSDWGRNFRLRICVL